jgi:uroporphyrinogen-III decarboxylase
MWYFDQTDMLEAKEMLGNTSCIVGNVTSSILRDGTSQDVKQHCRRLIESCAPGGGYILSGGVINIDKGKIENLQAIMEAAYKYGMYT